MTKLYIVSDTAGSYFEVDTDNFDFEAEYSVSDIADISRRKDKLSKTITLKGTKTNNQAFGNLFYLNRSTSNTSEQLGINYKPSKAVQAYVMENNVLIFKGDLRIVSGEFKHGEAMYTAIITGSLVNFWEKIGDKYLNELEGFNASHTYDYPTIVNSWNYELNNAYIYPSADYGKGVLFGKKDTDIRNFRCGIYLSTYFNNIFSAYGYSFKSQFLETDTFKKAYIPYSEKEFTRSVQATLLSTSGATTTYNLLADPAHQYRVEPLIFSGATSNSYVTISSKSITVEDISKTYQVFKFTTDTTTDITLNIDFSAVKYSGTDSVPLTFGVLPVSGSTFLFEPVTSKSYTISGGTGTTISEVIEIRLPFREYVADQEYAVVVYIQDEVGRTNGIRVSFNNPCVFKVGNNELKTLLGVKIGDAVNLQDVIPQGFKIKDFIYSVLQFFNLYIAEDPTNSNSFNIEPYDEFYTQFLNPKEYSINWTNKLDLSNGYHFDTNVDIPKKYNFKFKDDSDYWNDHYKKKYNESYGNSTVNDSEGISAEKNIEVAFSPTIIYQEAGKSLPTFYKSSNNLKESQKTNLRILYNNGTKDCNPYSIVLTDVSGATKSVIYSGLTSYNTSHHILYSGTTPVFNLQFGVPKEVYAPITQEIFTLPTLYSELYSKQLRELADSDLMLVECSVYLNEYDVQNLDFRTPIFLDFGDGGNYYFKLLSVVYKDKYTPSKVKLQKVIF